MTEAMRERLFLTLVGPIHPETPVVAIREFENLALADLDAIEPIILEIEQQAENRGRLAVYLEQCHPATTNEPSRQT